MHGVLKLVFALTINTDININLLFYFLLTFHMASWVTRYSAPCTSTKLVTLVYYSFSLRPRSPLRSRKLQWAFWFLVILLWNTPSYSWPLCQ